MANLGTINLSPVWQKFDGITITNINGTTSTLTALSTATYLIQNLSTDSFIAWDGVTVPANNENLGIIIQPSQTLFIRG